MRPKCLILFMAISLTGQQSTEPLDGPGWFRRGAEAYKSGRLPQAAEAFQKAVEMNPGDKAGHVYLGNIWLALYKAGSNSPQNLELAKKAEAEFSRVLSVDPENWTAIMSLGSLTFQEAQGMSDSPERVKLLEASRGWYETLVRLDPERKEVYYSLGVIAWSTWYPKWVSARIQCGLKSGDAGPIPDAAIRHQLKDQYDSTIENGIFNLQKVQASDPNYQNAVGYIDLFNRTRADLRDTNEEYLRDMQAAGRWMQKARQKENR
jgi:tetratricopeptide (TPR) repeat protein